MDYLFIAIGLGLLLLGGEVLVQGGLRLAARLRVAPAIVGVTVLGFGTSTPELVTSLEAASIGAPGIAIGNVLGSNIANVLLILGLAVVIAPVDPRGAAPRHDIIALAVATALAALLVSYGHISRGVGGLLLLALGVYLLVAIRAARAAPDAGPDLPEPTSGLWAVGLLVAGLGMTLWGAHLLVTSAVVLARALDISEAVIGLTLVAVGTSLPELATTVMAAIRGQGQLALGNILGSNVFNIFGILGITGVLVPIAVPEAIGMVDIAMLVAAAAILLALLALRRIGRLAGVAMLALYGGYIAWLA